MSSKIRVMVVCLLGSIVLLVVCSPEKTISASGELKNNCLGTVRDAGGVLVVGARILLVPELYMYASPTKSESGVDSTYSDSNGNYAFTVKSSGRFNLLAKKSDLYSMRRSVPLSTNTAIVLPGDTLQVPGSMTGLIRLHGMTDQSSAVILFIGTNTYAVPSGTTGAFSVNALAPGSYKLRILSTESGFAPVETTITVFSGKTTTLADIELRRNYLAIDSLSVVFDGAMMKVTLSWTPVDTSRIACYRIYLNRPKNLSPLVTVNKSLTTQVFDLITSPIDTFTYQIVAVKKDGSEDPGKTGRPFVKKSPVELVHTFSLQLPVSLYNPSLYIDRKGNIYVTGGKNILKFDSTGIKKAEYVLSDSSGSFDESLQSDDFGHLYASKWVNGTKSFMRFDSELKLVSELNIPTLDHFSLAVSGNGLVHLISTYGNRPFVDSASYTSAAFISVYDSNFVKIDEHPISEQIWADNYLFDDTIVSVHYGYSGSKARIFYYDNEFKYISSVEDFTFLGNYGYSWISSPANLTPNLYSTFVGPHGLIAVFNYDSTHSLLLFNDKRQVFARVPWKEFVKIFIDPLGNFYFFPEDITDLNATVVYKYSTVKLFTQSKP